MTNRYKNLDLIWAEDGSALDPDLDTSSPIFQKDKYVKGWIVEKEPHQWANFLYQITDQKFQFIAEEQFIEGENDITLREGAISRSGDNIFITSSGNTEAILSALSSDVVSSTNNLNTTLANHLASDNPHKDNIHQIGGYESGEIDLMFGDPTNPTTIVYHTNRTGKVHSETPQQLGTLPTSGGTFTGDVVFSGGISLGSGYVSADSSAVALGNPSGTISVDNSGLAVLSSGGTKSEITTTLNYQTHQQNINNQFTLPPPLVVFDFRSGGFGNSGPGIFGFEPGNTSQSFDVVKGWVVADGVLIDGWKNLGQCTWVAKTWVNDAPIFSVRSASAGWNGRELKLMATSIYGPSTHFESLVLYPPLTTYQKLCIMLTNTPQSYLRIISELSPTSGSPWYVTQVSPGNYTMLNATVTNGQILGGFVVAGNGVQYDRVRDGITFTTSDSSVISLSGGVQSNGQQTINLLKAGTATITVNWGGLVAKLSIKVS